MFSSTIQSFTDITGMTELTTLCIQELCSDIGGYGIRYTIILHCMCKWPLFQAIRYCTWITEFFCIKMLSAKKNWRINDIWWTLYLQHYARCSGLAGLICFKTGLFKCKTLTHMNGSKNECRLLQLKIWKIRKFRIIL